MPRYALLTLQIVSAVDDEEDAGAQAADMLKASELNVLSSLEQAGAAPEALDGLMACLGVSVMMFPST